MVSMRTPSIFQDLVWELDRMTRDMESAFGDSTVRPVHSRSGLRVGEKEAVFEVELPGVNADDLNIELEKQVLHIKAHRADLQADGEQVSLRERTFGTFEKSTRLPWPVRPEDVDAKFADGVLRIVLKKSPEAEPRRINVQRG